MSVFSTSYITSPEEGDECISFDYSEFAGRGFIKLLEEAILNLYPEIFNKIIDSKCVEFFPYHEFYRLDRNEIKLVIEKVDEYLIKNTANSKAEFYAKDIWEKDLRTELIKKYLSN